MRSIGSDEALIEWEFLLEDLEYVGYLVQLSGNLEFALDIWLLHYKCSKYLNNSYGMFQGLTYFCEHSYLLAKHAEIGGEEFLARELEPIYVLIVQELEFLQENFVKCTVRNRQYDIVLILAIQIAYYYAINHNYLESRNLLDYVLMKRDEINKLQGKEIYNCVMATYDMVQIRLYWKHDIAQDVNISDRIFRKETNATCVEADNGIGVPTLISTHQQLFSHIEETLERFRQYSSLYSTDLLCYSIILMSILEDVTECIGNRLADLNIQGFYLTALRLAIEAGLTLRFVNILISWMWLNLQQEYIDKAEVNNCNNQIDLNEN